MGDFYVGPRKNYNEMCEKKPNYMNCYQSIYDLDVTNVVKDIIFNNPATIVVWRDGTKTIVKCSEGDTYSKETGVALCFMKRYINNDNSFHKILKKYCTEDTK